MGLRVSSISATVPGEADPQHRQERIPGSVAARSALSAPSPCGAKLPDTKPRRRPGLSEALPATDGDMRAVKWRLWHGRVDRAITDLEQLLERVKASQADRWSLHGAHMLMQVRTADLNGELRNRLRAPYRQPEPNVPPFKPKPPLLSAA